MNAVRARRRSLRRLRQCDSRVPGPSSQATATEEPIVVEDNALDENECYIDLTSTIDDEVIDLSSSQGSLGGVDLLGANDNSVVIIGSPEQPTPAHRRSPRLSPVDENWLPDICDKPSQEPSSSLSANLMSPDPINISCPVCLEDYKTIKKAKTKFATTSCGHIFCQPCVEGCVRAQHCCPVCRKKLTLKNVFVIHL